MLEDSRRALTIASVAALLATAGDLAMLAVANAMRPELGLPRPPAFALPLGASLGVLSIPCYALGYRAVAHAIGPGSRTRSRMVLVGGTAAAALGAFIHGWTALTIRAALAEGAPSAAPVEAVAAEGGVLVGAWALASLGVLAASIAIFASGALRDRTLPRGLAWLNPVALTLLFALAGLPSELGRSFLLPAAPNVAHAVFFGCARRALGRALPPPLTRSGG